MSSKSRAVVSSLSALASFLLPLAAQAQTPALINYQGRLLNGTNLVNGSVGLSLRLFNASSGGTKLYEDSNTVVVADGLYSTFIGDHPTNDAFVAALTNPAVWVEVAVNGAALTPRERLASVSYALATRGVLVTTNASHVFNPSENAISPAADHATVAGGSGNEIQIWAYRSVIAGGIGNIIQSNCYASMLGGGETNLLQQQASFSFLGGGQNNTIQKFAQNSVVVGGYQNSIQTNSYYAFLGGGQQNSVGPSAPYSALVGGSQNSIQSGAYDAFLGGGLNNSIHANALNAFLGGGWNNGLRENAYYAFLGGGAGNRIDPGAQNAFLGGGSFNTVQTNASNAFLGGGDNNTIQHDATHAFLGGGLYNSVLGNALNAFLGGGVYNSVVGARGCVPGGFQNAAGADSFAAGYRAKATNDSSFVWADASAGADFGTTSSNQFLIRAVGGVGIGTTTPQSALHVRSTTNDAEISLESGSAGAHRWTIQSSGMYGLPYDASFQIIDRSLSVARLVVFTNGYVGIGTSSPTGLLHVAGNAYAAAWLTTSDRNAKQDIAPVDTAAILEKIAALPVAQWSFKAEPDVKHIGPMAQDFRAAFGLGPSETAIATVDADGVALAAIQALAKENAELKKQNEEILERLRALEAK